MDTAHTSYTGISIQVSLSGYSFKLSGDSAPSGWLGAEKLFTTAEFQHRYDSVEISLLTPKVALVPDAFFDRSVARKALEEVSAVEEGDFVEWVAIPSLASTLVYSNSIGESLSKVLSQTVLPSSGEPVRVLPELYFLLRDMEKIDEYNKILASWYDGYLHLVIARGRSLALANVFQAPDFTTAQYFIFLGMKQFQLNPEVSTVCFRTPLTPDAEMSLYRYFKSVISL